MLYLSHGDGDANLCRRDCGGALLSQPMESLCFLYWLWRRSRQLLLGFSGAPVVFIGHDIVAEEIEIRYLTTTPAWFYLLF